MAHRYPYIYTLHIAGCIADISTGMLFIEMDAAAGNDDAPGLQVHGGRRQTHAFQRLRQISCAFRRERSIEGAVEEQLAERLSGVCLCAFPHHGLAEGHLRGRAADGRDAGHHAVL